jgi:putative ABC transport system permease protein
VSGSLRVPQDQADPVIVPRLQIIGGDERFFQLATRAAPPPALTNDGVVYSQRLSDDLLERAPRSTSATGGEDSPWSQPQLVVTRPASVAIELPLGADVQDRGRRERVQPVGVLGDEALGRFDLRVSQLAPRNLFLARDALASLIEAAGMANLWVTDATPDAVREALRRSLLPADAGLILAPHGACAKVTSARLYLPPAQVEALRQITPQPVLANYHLADAFENAGGTRSTPYGFLAALSGTDAGSLGVVDGHLADDEVLISEWLAAELQVAPGDTVRVRWRRLAEAGQLVAEQGDFKVVRILPQNLLAAERAWMPEFPGLSEVESCADWDIGMPMDSTALNDPANEAYWKAYGPTPKLFMTHAAGRRCLGTLYGDTMVVRIGDDVARVTNGVAWAKLAQVEPEALGFEVRPLAAEGAQAVAQMTDFRQLFVGMSFFMMVSALLLTALLAQLALDHRRGEIGVLKACGMPMGRIMRVILLESAGVLAVGSIVGGLGGSLVSRGLVWSLNRAWHDAVAGTRIWPSFHGPSVLLAAGLVLVLAILILAAGSRRRLRETVLGLLSGGQRNAPRVRLRREGNGVGLMRAAVLNLWREPARSLLVAVLLAAGLFLPLAILAMKHDPAAGLDEAKSGSGGFRWQVEAPEALTENKGGEALLRAWPKAGIIGLRVREGDGAECLSLTRAQNPQVLGVPLEKLAATGAFGSIDWTSLATPLEDGCIPALAGDKTTLQYGLQAQAGLRDGTILTYPSSRGGSVRIRIIGTLPQRVTVLQGRILVDERLFTRIFPEIPGYRQWLVKPAEASAARPAGLLRQGWEIEGCDARLRNLAAMENSYLDMFLVLGGLGVVLGVAGLAILLLRNVETRRGELAVLRALGVPRRRVVGYLLVEQLGLMGLGLLFGLVPALLILLPAVVRLSQALPAGAIAVLILGYLAVGATATLAAASRALRKPLRDALRE